VLHCGPVGARVLTRVGSCVGTRLSWARSQCVRFPRAPCPVSYRVV
jgi:hypothetical protein